MIKICYFRSTKSSKIYLSSHISPSVKVRYLRMMYGYFVLLYDRTAFRNFIHNIGGFTIVVWYKHSVSNERYIILNNNSIVTVTPTNNSGGKNPNRQWCNQLPHCINRSKNHNMLNSNTFLRSQMKNLNFSVTPLHQALEKYRLYHHITCGSHY